MKVKRLLLIFLSLIVLLPNLVAAEEEPVKATGDKIWGDTQKKWAFLEGNVKIVQGSTVITTTKAEIDLDKKLVFLKENVRLVHPDVIIEADSLDYNLKKKSGTFTGRVVMNRIEKKDKKESGNKDPFKLSCDELVFESETKNFIAKKNGVMEHKDFTGKADLIEYFDGNQELYFKGNAYLKKPEGEEINGDQVKINLKDRSFIVQDNVTVKIEIEEDESAKDSSKGNKK